MKRHLSIAIMVFESNFTTSFESTFSPFNKVEKITRKNGLEGCSSPSAGGALPPLSRGGELSPSLRPCDLTKFKMEGAAVSRVGKRGDFVESVCVCVCEREREKRK
jgi:hypothetical protein